jgi:AraC-like DNA-binding protein
MEPRHGDGCIHRIPICSEPAALAAHVMKLIELHYDEPLTTENVAKRVGLSARDVRHAFRRAVGVSLRAYLTGIRMERARQLLQESAKIEAVALLVGYKSKRQFIRQFKLHAGMLPSRFRSVHGHLSVTTTDHVMPSSTQPGESIEWSPCAEESTNHAARDVTQPERHWLSPCCYGGAKS